MIQKQTIGKIQLVLGILILALGIFGLIFANNMYNKIQDSEIIEKNTSIYFSALSFPLNFALSSGPGILISLLFITQGLLNLSTNS